MVLLAFHGGTALRLLYSLPRHSEDLDFTLERKPELYDMASYTNSIARQFQHEGYEVEIKRSSERAVHNAWVRFVGLLFEMGLSSQRGEGFSIMLEVDTKPPAGVGLARSLVRRRVMLQLQHHDRPSLLAGKLHAEKDKQRPEKEAGSFISHKTSRHEGIHIPRGQNQSGC